MVQIETWIWTCINESLGALQIPHYGVWFQIPFLHGFFEVSNNHQLLQLLIIPVHKFVWIREQRRKNIWRKIPPVSGTWNYGEKT